MSPELLDPEAVGYETSRATEASDCYALGMVVYEVLSGEVPFRKYGPHAICRRVVDGERPKRPEGGWFTDEIWNILERCWEADSGRRPSVDCVLRCLEEASRSWTPALSSIMVVPREASPMQPHLGSVIEGRTGVARAGQPVESTGDILWESE